MPDIAPYRDASQPIQERVEDLLSRMALEEKVGQMLQIDGRKEPEYWVGERLVGSVLHALGEQTAHLQELACSTRLGIPLLFGIDAIHGNALWPGATVFPTQLAMSSSWNPALLHDVARATAVETRCTGAQWTFSPVLCITRDLRWGRVGETFGEDPYLIGELGNAMIRGYQGDDLAADNSLAACAKHYAGYSETQGGRDSAEADLSERKLRSYFLPPFERAAKAGCATFMTGYQAIDGVPCTANHRLMTGVLRDEWGYEGMVVTDWDNVRRLRDNQGVCATTEDAAVAAARAGNDMMMVSTDFLDAAVEAVRQGKLEEAVIDNAVRHILRLKFRLGLFEKPSCVDMEKVARVHGCAEHRALALEAATQSIVLLKNEGDLLPLGKALDRLAVIGPLAHNAVDQLGDWTFASGQANIVGIENPERQVVTVLQGLQRNAPPGCKVVYHRGCDALEPDTHELASAAALAAGADVAVVVLGDVLPMIGECCDRATLTLTGAQEQLLQAVHATGTPTVLVLVNSKPVAINWAAEQVPAIVEAWNPGTEGGNAVAQVLFGDRNPSGRLTVSFARHAGQQPVYYNRLPGWHTNKYADMTVEPLWPFGHGLSYTTFRYGKLTVQKTHVGIGEPVHLSVEVANTGKRAGMEIVQVYVHDVVSSATTPLKQLKAYSRVELRPREAKTVRIELPPEAFAIVDANARTVVESGAFEIMVGGSSRDADLLKTTVSIR